MIPQTAPSAAKPGKTVQRVVRNRLAALAVGGGGGGSGAKKAAPAPIKSRPARIAAAKSAALAQRTSSRNALMERMVGTVAALLPEDPAEAADRAAAAEEKRRVGASAAAATAARRRAAETATARSPRKERAKTEKAPLQRTTQRQQPGQRGSRAGPG